VGDWIVLLHVTCAFWFVSGLVGRGVTLAKARSATDIRLVGYTVELAGRFERWMVIPGSITVLLAGLLATRIKHIPFTGQGTRWLLLSLILFLSTLPLVPLVFIPRGRVFERELEDAKRRGEVPPALRTAFRDPAVAAARWYEVVAVAVIVTLMVVKPF
jgi:hypothetical protein